MQGTMEGQEHPSCPPQLWEHGTQEPRKGARCQDRMAPSSDPCKEALTFTGDPSEQLL